MANNSAIHLSLDDFSGFAGKMGYLVRERDQVEEKRGRTTDTRIFSPLLYLTAKR